MKRTFLILALLGLFVFTSTSRGGLGSFFQKIMQPVFKFSEKMLGQAIAASVKLQYGEWKPDSETESYVQGIFGRITSVAERQDVKWSLTILKPSFVNAFAVPGGHVYITRGLLSRVKTDDELAAVLGHEVGHVVAKHSMNSVKHQVAYQLIINQMNKRSDKLKTMGQIYSLFAGLRYSRKNEHEADYYGARYAALAGFNPRGMVDFLGVLQEQNPREPGQIETSIRSHPPTSRRIKRMQEYVTSFPEATQRPRNLSYDYAAKYPAVKKKTEDKSVKSEHKDSTSTAPTDLSQESAIVYSQAFDESENSAIAKGLKSTMNQGIYVLDDQVKYSGKSSQRLTSYKKGSLGLISESIKVKAKTRYKVRVFMKLANVVADSSPMGYGACLNITELSSRQFLGSYSGIFSKIGTTGGFEELSFELETRSDTSFLTVEFALRESLGQVWFDDFTIEKL